MFGNWDPQVIQYLLWGSISVAGVGLVLIALYLAWRYFAQPKVEEEPEVSWEDFVAGMHDRLDQCELLLKQFAQRSDKQHQELQESVTHLQAAVDALEKPFSAVATRFSQVGQDSRGRMPR